MQKTCFSILFIFIGMYMASAQMPARLVQYPDVSETHICFTYGDDLWLVEKSGGDAIKLSSPIGRETFPKFSPDGQTIAYHASYDGNADIYTIPIRGGVPKQVTGHGMNESIQDWYADGKAILYSSSSESGKQRFSQFYQISSDGGLPAKLPVMVGANAAISADGTKLAFTEKSRAFRSWKRYRGGTAPDIYIMDLGTLETERITDNDANDEIPMWHGDKLYYMSDNDEYYRNNIWVYDTSTGQHKQVTFFKDFDVHFPSIGPSEMVFEAGGKVQLMDLASHNVKEIEINAIGDFTRIKPVTKSVKNNITNYNVSPDGARVVMEARGDVFTLPKKEGFVKNTTRTSGTAERFPSWSPDGKSIAYFSDASGEYELTIRNVKSGVENKITNLGAGYRYHIHWSPNSDKVVFVDHSMTIHMVNVKTKAVTVVDQATDLFEWGLRSFRVSWSPDSKYFAYTKTGDNGNSIIYIYDSNAKVSKPVTSGFYTAFWPTFDPDGKYLYALTDNNFEPMYSDMDNTWIYANATQIGLFTLTKDEKSPMAPKNDEVEIEEEEAEEEDDNKKKDKKGKKDKEDVADDEPEVEPTKIDFDGFERRMITIPDIKGNFWGLTAVSGKIVYVKSPNTGSDAESSDLKYFDLEEHEEKTIISGINGFRLSADGESILINKKGSFSVIGVSEGQEAEDQVPTSDLKATINPREEWAQIFNDVWRFERDFFYDEDMHGVDWDALKVRYGSLVENAMGRYDLNFIIGELIGELNASHTYRGGGDDSYPAQKNTGYLGVDWTKENGAFKIKRIVRAADWDSEIRSPLDMPGVNVNEGDYVLAVNGIPMTEYSDPWLALRGMAGKTVELTVNSTANMSGSRKVLVEPIRSETRLRNLEWIEQNRQYVDKMSDGKIGYIYVPSTGWDGQNELTRMFYGQWNKEGLIVDERFNNGGQIPDRFIELLNRKPLAYFNVRNGKEWQWPPVAHFGPKAMLINGWSGSGGDAFPDYFKKSELGPLIGTRTWGGVIGISGSPPLIDGGGVTVPTFRMYDPEGNWFAEGHGVEPDIEVLENPTALAKGEDVQLKKAVEYILGELKKVGKIHPDPPAKEDRSK